VSPSKFPQPAPLLDDLRPLRDAGRVPGCRRVFPPTRPFAAPPQTRFPVRTIRAPLDPVVDRGRRHAACALVGSVPFHPAGDLLGRPLLRQAGTDQLVELRIVQLAHERPFATAPLSLLLSLAGVIRRAGAVAGQLATDGRGGAAEVGGDIVLQRSLTAEFGYAIAFVNRKL